MPARIPQPMLRQLERRPYLRIQVPLGFEGDVLEALVPIVIDDFR